MIKSFERMVAEAAVTGSKDVAVAALVANKLCDSDAVANEVFDELCEAHRDYLPQFYNEDGSPREVLRRSQACALV